MTTKVRSSVLADTAVTPEKYGGTQTLQTITVDAQGRITHAANITSGVVTADTTGQGASILVPSIRFNALGQIVEATNTTIRSATTSVTGVVQLVDSVSSTSTTSAATGSAVKTAYDAAVNALNASNISSGTLPTARLSGSYTGITGVGTLSAGSVPSSLVSGLASSATTDTTSATNITSGTLPTARLSGSYTGITGVGTLAAGSIPASLVSGLASSATTNALNATNISSGTLSVDRLPYTMNQGVATSSNPQFNTLGLGTAPNTGQAGSIRMTGDIEVGYSDDNLKTRLGNIQDALKKVSSISGFFYEPNQVAQDLGYQVKREVGVSAQEIQAVLPEVVIPAPIDDRYLTVKYDRLVPLLIEAIKELTEKVEVLENKIKDK